MFNIYANNRIRLYDNFFFVFLTLNMIFVVIYRKEQENGKKRKTVAFKTPVKLGTLPLGKFGFNFQLLQKIADLYCSAGSENGARRTSS